MRRDPEELDEDEVVISLTSYVLVLLLLLLLLEDDDDDDERLYQRRLLRFPSAANIPTPSEPVVGLSCCSFFSAAALLWICCCCCFKAKFVLSVGALNTTEGAEISAKNATSFLNCMSLFFSCCLL
jgi:hypothetical protein